MPWRTNNVMDLKMEFVRKALQPGTNFRALCREAGISPKTGYKWKERFLGQGRTGLHDESRRPKSSPTQLPEGVVCELVRLKQAHRAWGPRKIRQLYIRLHGSAPCESSCKRILSKAGLVEPRRLRSHYAVGRLTSTIKVEAPNDLWTVDFKGWWRISNGQRCEPLTVRDAYSRFILTIRAMTTTASDAVRSEFEHLFTEYGLPRAIRSDNGTPFATNNGLFGLTRLSAWWMLLGISLDRIRPGHPGDNGDHERMHRDIGGEIEGLISGGLLEQQAALDLWRKTFNCERPHEALNMRTPSELYRRSQKHYDGTPISITYDGSMAVRRVRPTGGIKVHSNEIFISQSLAGLDLGLRSIENDRVEVWFAYNYLGFIDLTTEAFVATSGRSERLSPCIPATA
jgi:putative transposase